MQRANIANIKGNQLNNSIFMTKSVVQQIELVRSLNNIETLMVLGDLELGLGAIRELIGGLPLSMEAQKQGKKIMSQNNVKKFKLVEKLESQSMLALRIYTMGRFSVVVDGKPIVFRTKAQKKPMDLLKTMIALGGRGVSKSQLTDLLWPDSAGDACVSVINTTLSRLRKLIGKDAILTESGCLSLNPQYCWVDCWEFERLLNAGKNREGLTNDVVNHIFDLYQGHFLVGEEDGWLVSRREKLRNKLLHVCSKQATLMMENKQFKLASFVLSKCIEVDDLNEEFYISLMQCQIQLNQPSEAVMTYRRCYKSISTFLGVLPSDECRKLYLSIQGN